MHGVADVTRVVDLSRAAMAALMGVSTSSLTEATAGVIRLDRIEIAPPGARLGLLKTQ